MTMSELQIGDRVKTGQTFTMFRLFVFYLRGKRKNKSAILVMN